MLPASNKGYVYIYTYSIYFVRVDNSVGEIVFCSYSRARRAHICTNIPEFRLIFFFQQKNLHRMHREERRPWVGGVDNLSYRLANECITIVRREDGRRGC